MEKKENQCQEDMVYIKQADLQESLSALCRRYRMEFETLQMISRRPAEFLKPLYFWNPAQPICCSTTKIPVKPMYLKVIDDILRITADKVRML